MWSFATSSYKVNKCVTVSRMLSGRFRCGSLLRHMYPIFNSKDDKAIVQMLLDPSIVPEIIAATQNEAQVLELLLSVTTTWCYTLNRTRIKLLGK